jgi:aspartate/methionine/tyrosine aminotransferase
MYPTSPYLAWAEQMYRDLPFDLATSGIPSASMADLDGEATLDDRDALPALREALARRYKVSAAEVVPAQGTSGALFLAYAALLSSGDGILIEEPAYPPLVLAAEALGLRVKRFPRTTEQNYALDPWIIARALDKGIRAVVVSQLHNPTGVAASHESLRAVAALMAPRGGFLIVDEVYHEVLKPRRTTRVLANNIVALSSLTKCFGLGFLRAGWLLLPPEHVPAVWEVIRTTVGHPAPVLLRLAERGVTNAETLAKRRKRLMAGKRARVDAWLASEEHLEWAAPPHADSLFGFVRHARPENLRAKLEQGRVDQGVLAVPGEFFGDPSGFRLGMTLPSAKLDTALRRLGQVVR